VFLYALDLLELNSEDYRQHSLEKRKAKLEKILARIQGMRFSEHSDGDEAPAMKRSFGREKRLRRCRQSEMWWVSRGNGFGRFQSTNVEAL